MAPESHRKRVVLGVALVALGVACAKVPFTGRLQYNVIPDPLMRTLGATTYTSMLSSVDIEKKGEDADVLGRVGKDISRVADQPKYDWDFTLIDDDAQVNAWCLPGGKIGFYTGILPALRNEAGMAFVMGHEVGHATAHHGSERMTQQLTLIGGLVGLELLMQKETKLTDEQRAIVLGALGVGATVGVLLPFSRMHEAEADVIGLMYMSKAGFPPEESLKVWDRMNKVAGGSAVPQFLSTHPSHKNRKANLRAWMDRADKRFERNALKRDSLALRWKLDGSTPDDGDQTDEPDEDSTRTRPSTIVED
jgi:metalloendopeptidase OMA1, mitochondrial